MYLSRAVDSEVLDVLVQPKRNQRTAHKLMRKLLTKQGMVLDECSTEKKTAYRATLREPKLTRAPHTRRKQANYRAESSHAPVRRREQKKDPSRPGQPSGSCPCTRLPTTRSRFLATLSQLALTASSEPKRSRPGEMRLTLQRDIVQGAPGCVRCPTVTRLFVEDGRIEFDSNVVERSTCSRCLVPAIGGADLR
jgi:DDE domain